MLAKKTYRKKKEEFGRQKVCQHLESRGFTLHRECWRLKGEDGNLLRGLGEIDMFFVQASKKWALLIEVKSRSRDDAPLIDELQLIRLRKSLIFLRKNHPGYRIHLGLAHVKVPEGQLEFLWNP